MLSCSPEISRTPRSSWLLHYTRLSDLFAQNAHPWSTDKILTVKVQISFNFLKNEGALPCPFPALWEYIILTWSHPTRFHHCLRVRRSSWSGLCPPSLVCSWLINAFRRKGLSKRGSSWLYQCLPDNGSELSTPSSSFSKQVRLIDAQVAYHTPRLGYKAPTKSPVIRVFNPEFCGLLIPFLAVSIGALWD